MKRQPKPKRATCFAMFAAPTAALLWLAAPGCASSPPLPPEPIPPPISAELDSGLRMPCEGTIRHAAATGERVYREKEVDSAADMIWEKRGPKSPHGATGTVKIEFVVDSAGRADMRTLRPLLPAYPDLFVSVRTFLPSAKYKPARVGGHPVAQCVNQTFVFEFRGPINADNRDRP
jgi:hypothetical protein